MKTLIAEDDFVSGATLRKLLNAYGLCDLAENGEDAEAAFQKALADGEPYDLVCLDIMMPKMDGHEVLASIRATEDDRGILLGDGAKIIMTTALGDAKNVMSAFRDQCDAYLVKPVSKAALVERLSALGLMDT
jgi:two-component system, chemotaxis family, chemotaxis protein CheY